MTREMIRTIHPIQKDVARRQDCLEQNNRSLLSCYQEEVFGRHTTTLDSIVLVTVVKRRRILCNSHQIEDGYRTEDGAKAKHSVKLGRPTNGCRTKAGHCTKVGATVKQNINSGKPSNVNSETPNRRSKAKHSINSGTPNRSIASTRECRS